MENENKTTHTVLRVLVVGGILAILIFLSIGIVRVIPRAVNALASASVSIGSIFKSNYGSTTNPNANGFYTTSTSTQNGVYVAHTQPTSNATTSTATNTGSYPDYSPTPYSPTSANNNNNATAGTPDLAVTILSRGVLDHATGQYTETNNFTTSDTVVVKFKVENRGNAPTGAWDLRVIMPSTNSADQTRSSNGNHSLPSGSAVTGQAIFTQPSYGTNSVVSIAAELTQKSELDSTNNAASTILSVSGSNGGNTAYPGNTGVQADLAGTVVAVGILDSNNNFTATNVFHSYDRVALQFKVTNTGSNPTGAWSFRADMSGNPVKTYTSNELSISPNSTLIYIVGFSNPQIGYDNVNIYLDSNNNVIESNEGNNVLSANFNVVN